MVNGRWIGGRLGSVFLFNTVAKCVDGIDDLSSSDIVYLFYRILLLVMRKVEITFELLILSFKYL